MTVIEGVGTPESTWTPWLDQVGWPELVPGAGAPPGRAVVLAAHPDDEVLGAGGLLHLLARSGWRVDVVWASDGEGSHPGSTVLVPAELARRRRQESTLARQELGLSGRTTWLGRPDSGLQQHENAVTSGLDEVVAGPGAGPADLLVAPWHADGHPDHEVCGRAALRVGAAHGLPVVEVPIWAWHWGTPQTLAPRWTHARTVRLDEPTRAAKAAAVRRFVSQVQPLGPAPADRAVLPEQVLVRFARPVEVALVTAGRQP
ncbi:PIG-L deacetylase family protein [Jannaschia sp. R86511]|uniref:PIG-L deacetylase family protein n=1 Tax=Jannaschia sp. R86511 TaxID=3093853 RepID=UPI0036D3D84E